MKETLVLDIAPSVVMVAEGEFLIYIYIFAFNFAIPFLNFMDNCFFMNLMNFNAL